MSETDPASIDHARAARYQAEEGRHELGRGARTGEVSGQSLARAGVRAALSTAEGIMDLGERVGVIAETLDAGPRSPTVAESLERLAAAAERIAAQLERR